MKSLTDVLLGAADLFESLGLQQDDISWITHYPGGTTQVAVTASGAERLTARFGEPVDRYSTMRWVKPGAADWDWEVVDGFQFILSAPVAPAAPEAAVEVAPDVPADPASDPIVLSDGTVVDDSPF